MRAVRVKHTLFLLTTKRMILKENHNEYLFINLRMEVTSILTKSLLLKRINHQPVGIKMIELILKRE